MSRKPPTIHISNPAALAGGRLIIVLELADQDAAIRAAQEIAQETGCGVTVRDADMAVIETVPGVRPH